MRQLRLTKFAEALETSKEMTTKEEIIEIHILRLIEETLAIVTRGQSTEESPKVETTEETVDTNPTDTMTGNINCPITLAGSKIESDLGLGTTTLRKVGMAFHHPERDLLTMISIRIRTLV